MINIHQFRKRLVITATFRLADTDELKHHVFDSGAFFSVCSQQQELLYHYLLLQQVLQLKINMFKTNIENINITYLCDTKLQTEQTEYFAGIDYHPARTRLCWILEEC